jgi:hypothetical protein
VKPMVGDLLDNLASRFALRRDENLVLS